MKATDLMIGDWMYAIDNNGEKHPCRASDLRYDYTNKRDEFSLDFYGTGYKPVWPDVAFNVEPIPLTPEILKKNGWYYNDAVGEWCGGGLYIGGYRPKEYIILDGRRIRYVHELQHALKLCGIEKEIVL